MTQLTDHISFDDLSDDMKLVAQSCRLEVARSLIVNCPGIQIYVPRPESMMGILRRNVNTRLEGREPSELDLKQIALELRKSPGFVRQLVRIG
jgi:hypothetical protein